MSKVKSIDKDKKVLHDIKGAMDYTIIYTPTTYSITFSQKMEDQLAAMESTRRAVSNLISVQEGHKKSMKLIRQNKNDAQWLKKNAKEIERIKKSIFSSFDLKSAVVTKRMLDSMTLELAMHVKHSHDEKGK